MKIYYYEYITFQGATTTTARSSRCAHVCACVRVCVRAHVRARAFVDRLCVCVCVRRRARAFLLIASV